MTKKKPAKKPAKRKHAPRPKQTFIPGAEPDCIPELDAAMENYHGTKLARMSYLEDETKQKAEVRRLMKEHNIEIYKDEAAGLIAKVKPHEMDVSVKRIPGANGEAEVEEE